MPKILVADDSRFQVELLSNWLSEKGATVVVAGDALQAWMKALRTEPDAIILDINMPGGTGLEVLKRLRLSAKTQHIPVIVVSSNQESEQSARSLGAAEFLPKPLDSELLAQALTRLLGQQF